MQSKEWTAGFCQSGAPSQIGLHCSLIYCSMVKYFGIIQPCNSHLVCEDLHLTNRTSVVFMATSLWGKAST